MGWFRGVLCLQFFTPQRRRAFLSAAPLHFPQTLSFLFALTVAQTHGPKRLPRSAVRAATFRTQGLQVQTLKPCQKRQIVMAARIALCPAVPRAETRSASRISGRMLFL